MTEKRRALRETGIDRQILHRHEGYAVQGCSIPNITGKRRRK